jgi:hypothetical protein
MLFKCTVVRLSALRGATQLLGPSVTYAQNQDRDRGGLKPIEQLITAARTGIDVYESKQ